MRIIAVCIGFLLSFTSASVSRDLETIAAFEERLANFTISSSGRTFFTKLSLGGGEGGVLELEDDGHLATFPRASEAGGPSGQITTISNAIGIRAVGDALYVLDMGNPSMEVSPKLVTWSISTGLLQKVQFIPRELLRENSFLQGFVVDSSQTLAVIADMTDPMGGRDGPQPTNPAFVVIDLRTGFGARLLENHPSFRPSAGGLTIGGRRIQHKPADGPAFVPDFPLNPIAISPDDQWVYYGAMSGEAVYRLPLEFLRRALSGDSSLPGAVNYYSEKPKSDGIDVDDAGNIYVGNLEGSSIMRVRPGESHVLAQDDERLEWPDSLYVAKDGYLYILAHGIDRLAAFNAGVDLPKKAIYFNKIGLERQP